VRSLIAAVVVLLGAPGVAGAAVTPGDYGGGALSARWKVGDGWTWARVAANGRARIGGAIKVACGLAVFDAEVTLGPDGSFRFTRVRRVPESQNGHRLRTKVTVEGRFDGTGASGTVTGRLRNRHPDGTVRRCSTRGAKPWQLRMRPAPGAAAAPHPGGEYLGLTSEQGDVPRPFVLRVAGNGTRIATTIFEYTRQCRRRSYFLNEMARGGRIRPDGTFSVRNRFTLRYTDVPQVERFVVRIDGQFSGGMATGTLRVTSVARRRGTDRVVDRCDTGPLTFGASL
jgi:hypothetical protein